jgi:DNA polymerase alpha-associated DNA helicase A
VFIDTAGSEYYERTEGDHDEGSKCNENEAMVVKKYITRLVRLWGECESFTDKDIMLG